MTSGSEGAELVRARKLRLGIASAARKKGRAYKFCAPTCLL